MSGPEAPAPRITALRATGREGERTVVTLSDDREFTLPTGAVVEFGLSCGSPVDAQLGARLVEAELRFRAKGIALRLLSYRPRSRRELHDRLRQGELPKAVVTELLGELEALGLIDDRAFAESFVRDRVRVRPRGRRALRAELAGRGVREEAEAAIEAVFTEEGVDERSLAREVAAGWLRRQPRTLRAAFDEVPSSDPRRRALRRYLGYMQRRGFSAGLARDVLAEVRRRS